MDLFDFTSYIGKNAYNVQSDFEYLYPGYQIILIHQNSDRLNNYRLDRIQIFHNENNVVLNIIVG